MYDILFLKKILQKLQNKLFYSLFDQFHAQKKNCIIRFKKVYKKYRRKFKSNINKFYMYINKKYDDFIFTYLPINYYLLDFMYCTKNAVNIL